MSNLPHADQVLTRHPRFTYVLPDSQARPSKALFNTRAVFFITTPALELLPQMAGTDRRAVHLREKGVT